MCDRDSVLMPRPMYEALDGQGLPYERPARCVGELPSELAKDALAACLARLAERIGQPASSALKLGLPVHTAFGLTRAQAKNHRCKDLLLTPAAELSLDFCALFAPAAA